MSGEQWTMNDVSLSFQIPHSLPAEGRRIFNLKSEIKTLPISVSPYLLIYLFPFRVPHSEFG
jgi:hypothetical protein